MTSVDFCKLSTTHHALEVKYCNPKHRLTAVKKFNPCHFFVPKPKQLTVHQRPLTVIWVAEAQDCSEETAATNAFFAAPAFPCRAEVPILSMLTKASETADFESALVLTVSAAF